MTETDSETRNRENAQTIEEIENEVEKLLPKSTADEIEEIEKEVEELLPEPTAEEKELGKLVREGRSRFRDEELVSDETAEQIEFITGGQYE